jgi:hypothetical protein
MRLATGGPDKNGEALETDESPWSTAFPVLARDYPLKRIWSPDSKLLAGRCQDETSQALDAATFETRVLFQALIGPGRLVITKPILVSFRDRTTKYCDVATGKDNAGGSNAALGNWDFDGHFADRRSAAIADHTHIQLWDIALERLILYAGREARAVAISPNGLTVISGGDERRRRYLGCGSRKSVPRLQHTLSGW